MGRGRRRAERNHAHRPLPAERRSPGGHQRPLPATASRPHRHGAGPNAWGQGLLPGGQIGPMRAGPMQAAAGNWASGMMVGTPPMIGSGVQPAAFQGAGLRRSEPDAGPGPRAASHDNDDRRAIGIGDPRGDQFAPGSGGGGTLPNGSGAGAGSGSWAGTELSAAELSAAELSAAGVCFAGSGADGLATTSWFCTCSPWPSRRPTAPPAFGRAPSPPLPAGSPSALAFPTGQAPANAAPQVIKAVRNGQTSLRRLDG